MGLLPAPWRKLACSYAGIVAIQRGWIFQLATLAAATICVEAFRWAQIPRGSRDVAVRAWTSLPLVLTTALTFAALAFLESNPGYPIEAAVAFAAALLASLLKRSPGESNRPLMSSTSSLAGWLLLAAGLLLLESATVRLASDCASVGLAQLDVALAAAWLLLGMSMLGADWCCRPSPGVTSSSSATACVPLETSVPLPLIDLLTFSFLDATVAAGEARQLGLEDMLNVPPAANTALASTRLLLQQGDRKDPGQPGSSLPTPLAPRHVPSETLWASLVSQYWRPWLALGGLQAASTALGFAGPALLNALLSFVGAAAAADSSGTGEASPWRGLLWAALLPLQAGVGALVSTQFAYRVQLLQLQVRASVTAAVFHRMLSRGAEATSGAVDAGAVVNFVSVDVQRLMDAVSSLHQLWSLPVQVAVTLYLLYTQLRWAFLAGVCVLAVFTPLNVVVSRRIGALTAVMMAHRDVRVRVTGELLQGMRSVKALAWEEALLRRIRAARVLEFRALAARKYLDAVCVFLWASTPVLISLATFVSASALDGGGSLSAAQVFTSLSLLNLLIVPMNAFPWVLTGLLEARVSLRRLDEFFAQTLDPGLPLLPPSAEESGAAVEALAPCNGSETPLLDISGRFQFPPSAATASVSPPASFVLQLPAGKVLLLPGQLVVLCGEVGSGKSMLLRALLGELAPSPKRDSSDELGRCCIRSAVAVAPQVPWVRTASVRDNIVFGAAFDAARYAAVLDACSLGDDVVRLPFGDATVVSEGTLSGGQKQRIGLARALYDLAPALLLDDPLSALDATVGRAVWLRGIGRTPADASCGTVGVAHARQSLLDREARARIIVTQDLGLIDAADIVIVMAGGRVTFQGPPADCPSGVLPKVPPGGLAPSLSDAVTPAVMQTVVRPSDQSSDSPFNAAMKDEVAAIAAPDEAETLTEDEHAEFRQEGVLRRGVVLDYVVAVGTGLSALLLAALTVMQLSRNASDWWMSVWSSAALGGASDGGGGGNGALIRSLAGWGPRHFEAVYVGIACVNVFATAVRSVAFAFAGLRAARLLHDRLLASVAWAPMAFHDATPAGRIINRLSADQYAIDETLPFQANILLAGAWGLGGTCLVLAYATYGAFIIGAIPLALVYWRLQFRYRQTSREVKRLDSVTRSPLLGHFSECLAGAAVIRAHSRARNAASGALWRELSTCVTLLDLNQRTSFVSGAASQWLALRLQVLGMAVLALVALVAVLLAIFEAPGTAAVGDDAGCEAAAYKDAEPPSISAGSTSQSSAASGLTGLAISYAIPIVGGLQSLMNSAAETEKEAVSVERILEYAGEPSEDAADASAAAAAGAATQRDSQPTALADVLVDQGGSLAEPLLSSIGPAPGSTHFALGTRDQPRVAGAVSFVRASVTYPGAIGPALSSFSCELAPGTITGLCGRTGSGKSTAVAALLRLVPLDGGAITLDGLDIRSIPRAVLRRSIAVIPQEPLCLAGTVRDNLDPDSRHSDEELEQVLRSCRLMPQGTEAHSDDAVVRSLDTVLEAGGRNWSVGQRQLLSVARALLLDCRVVCLDEATAAQDPRSEALLWRVLRESFGSAAVLCVAHRLATLFACDNVLVISNGRCIEEGAPATLAKRPGGHFAALTAEAHMDS